MLPGLRAFSRTALLNRPERGGAVVLVYAGTGSATSPPYTTVSTIATSASLSNPSGVWGDTNGKIYAADSNNYANRVIQTSSLIQLFNNDFGTTYIAYGIVTDANNNIFYSTLGGNVYKYLNGATSSTSITGLYYPAGLFVDAASTYLYFADYYYHRITRITISTSTVTVSVAGSGTSGYSGNGGAATSANLNAPYGVWLDTSNNNIYIADTNNHIIRKVSSASIITLIAGQASTSGYSGDGAAASSAKLNSPKGLFGDTSGNLFIADTNNNVIRKIATGTSIISTIAGIATGISSYSSSITSATSVYLSGPTSIFCDTSGNIYIADKLYNNIRKLTSATPTPTMVPTGPTSIPTSSPVYMLLTLGGTGSSTSPAYIASSTVATSASFSNPSGVWIDSNGNAYIADTGNLAIRKLSTDGNVVTLRAAAGSISYPIFGIWGDTSNNIYYSTKGGYVYNTAGATITSATYYPTGICGNAAGTLLYYAEYVYHSVFSLTISTGTTYTQAVVAGSQSTTGGYSGNGGAATSALLNYPYGVWVDKQNNMYIADTNNNVIRKVSLSTNIISTFAGNSVSGYSGNGGAATSASLKNPRGVFGDTIGNIYIADSANNVIRQVAYATGIISTISGSGATTGSFSSASIVSTSAYLSVPTNGWFNDNDRSLVFTDSGNHAIRKHFLPAPSSSPTPIPSNSPSSIPTMSPSNYPSPCPSQTPSVLSPTSIPTSSTTTTPTVTPSESPSSAPTSSTTTTPTVTPSESPSSIPTSSPTTIPSVTPSEFPSSIPTSSPTTIPSVTPSVSPSSNPTSSPTTIPTVTPSESPSSIPTSSLTTIPTVTPSESPSYIPTSSPTTIPTVTPSESPSCIPTSSPTTIPT
eukprot:gene11338-15203_t